MKIKQFVAALLIYTGMKMMASTNRIAAANPNMQAAPQMKIEQTQERPYYMG